MIGVGCPHRQVVVRSRTQELLSFAVELFSWLPLLNQRIVVPRTLCLAFAFRARLETISPQYLLPLAVPELFLHTRDRGGLSGRFARAGGLVVLTAAMGIGIAVATTALWLPHLWSGEGTALIA